MNFGFGDYVEYNDQGAWRIGTFDSEDDSGMWINCGNGLWNYSRENVRPAEDAPMWLRAARQFAGEAVANDEPRYVPNREDRENIAYYHPAGEWGAMSADDRSAAQQLFRCGRDIETEYKTGRKDVARQTAKARLTATPEGEDLRAPQANGENGVTGG